MHGVGPEEATRPGDAILVLNAGSSSLRFQVFRLAGEQLEAAVSGRIEELGSTPRFTARNPAGLLLATRAWPQQLGHEGATAFLLAWLAEHAELGRVAAVGHRVVHGGACFDAPIRLTPAVLRELEMLVPLAPLHQGANLLPITALASQAPDLPQVACFDTAFHRSQPALAQMFALPRALSARGIHRYGFHGLSYEYVATALPSYDAAAAAGRTVVLHLGNGASMCALSAGKSVATTMGFTALDGLPMGTRCGSLDPGVVLYLLDTLGMDARSIERLLYHESGLLGVSGLSSDMRVLLASADPHAREAIALFCYRIGRELGSLAAALGGLDALVFTAGIGEHAVAVRERVCQDAAWLGVVLDAEANAASARRISAAESRVRVWVIPTDEELMIARHVRALLGL